MARQITYNSEINCPSFTINNVCGSGMISIIEGLKSIQCKKQIYHYGGVGSACQLVYLNYDIRKQTKFEIFN